MQTSIQAYISVQVSGIVQLSKSVQTSTFVYSSDYQGHWTKYICIKMYGRAHNGQILLNQSLFFRQLPAGLHHRYLGIEQKLLNPKHDQTSYQ